MREQSIVPPYRPQPPQPQPFGPPLTQQLVVQLVLPRARYMLGLRIATPIDRPLVIKEPAFYTAKKTTL